MSLIVAVAGSCALAGLAQAAAPAWKLLAVTGPTNLPPRQSEVQRLAVEAEGGTFTLSSKGVEGTGTPAVAEAHLSLAAGSVVATIEGITGEAKVEPGDRVALPGEYEATTIVSCSAGCETPGSTLELSEPAPATESSAVREIYTRELAGVTGSFRVGEEISKAASEGYVFEYFAPGTVVTAAASGKLTLSNPTTSEYSSAEGTLELTTATATTKPIAFDASAQEVQQELEALPMLGAGSLTVEGGPGGSVEAPYFVDFAGAGGEGRYADQNVEQLAVDGTELAGNGANAYLFTTVPGGPGTGEIVVAPANIGGAGSHGVVTLRIGPLPSGIRTTGPAEGTNWKCPQTSGEATVVCTSIAVMTATAPTEPVRVPVEVEPTIASSSAASIEMSGGGAVNAASFELPIEISNTPASFATRAFWAGAFDADGNQETQAGAHPFSAQTSFMVNTVRSKSGQVVPAGVAKNAEVDLPAGFSGDPLVTARCPQSQVTSGSEGAYALCNSEMSVGTFAPTVGSLVEGGDQFAFKIYNDVPARGSAAEFSTKIAFPVQSLLGSVRSSEDFGVRITAPNIANIFKVYGSYASLEGEPASAHGQAFLTNPSDCAEEARSPVVTGLQIEAYESPGVFDDASATVPAVTGCNQLKFDPSFSFQPTTSQGSSPVGATADLHVSQEGLTDPNSLASPDLKKAVVTLPQGLSVNPSSANGLEACSEAQVGYEGPGAMPNPTRFDEEPVSCPDGSKLGTVSVKTPLLEEELQGTIYLAAQEENPFHSLIALYLVVESERFGITLKLPGEVKADPATGQLTAVFDNNPQLPFEDLTLHFRGGGPRSTLATPEVCGSYSTTGELTPWSAPESGPAALIQEAGFTVSSGCASSAAARPFAPSFEAGTTSPAAGSHSPLVIKVARNDGEQELSSLAFTLPEGLIGNVAGVPYCSDAAIEAARGVSGRAEQANPSCPTASQIGTVDTSAGVGSEPIHVGGSVYLAGPYEGAPLSAVVITPAVAGPFDLGDVVVRAPLSINPATAQITTRSDAIPTILRGIPLKVRSVAITLDRPGFTFNPTSCEAMSVTASIASSNGAVASPSSRFQAGGCAGLSFKPALSAWTKGKASKAGGASLTVKIAAKAGEANIHKVNLQLPVVLPSRLTTLQKACTEAQFNANPAGCPVGSVIGSAVAHTPILQAPLSGPAYLVSHGGAAFPDVEFVLQAEERGGDIEIVLDGHTQIKKGITYSSFESVPDAPITSFETILPQGPHSILDANLPASANYDFCGRALRMPTTLTGQNGAVLKQDTPVTIEGCSTTLSFKHVIRKHTLTLTVYAPAAGKITAAGKGLTGKSKTAKGQENLTITLQQKHTGKLKTTVRIAFTPSTGKDRKKQSKTAKLTFKR